MNVEQAFQRKSALERRLAAAAAIDFTQERSDYKGECREAIGGHSAPNYRGHCAYCDAFLCRITRPAASKTHDLDFEDVTHPVFLTPVVAAEREDVLIAQRHERLNARRWKDAS